MARCRTEEAECSRAPLARSQKDHQLFAGSKPQSGGVSAHVQGAGGQLQQVVQDAADFRVKHPDQAGAARPPCAGQTLDRQTPGMLDSSARRNQPVQIGRFCR